MRVCFPVQNERRQKMFKSFEIKGYMLNLALILFICISLVISGGGIADAQPAPLFTKDKQAEEFLNHAFDSRDGVNVAGVKRKWLDVPYATLSSAEKLDIYLPKEGEGVFPVIVAIHGGSFSRGDKRDFQIVPIMEALKRGYAVISINYRLSGEAKFPNQIYDVKAAIRWIRSNAGQYFLNSRKIAVWGDSAGGNLAALVGTSGNVKELEDLSMGNPDQSSNVSAVVDWYGPINFLTMGDIQRLERVGNKMIGKTSTEAPELYLAASPETYISPGNPPFLIQHGNADKIISIQQSADFAAKLKNVLGKDRVIFDIVKGADHLDKMFNTPENINKVLDFLDIYMK